MGIHQPSSENPADFSGKCLAVYINGGQFYDQRNYILLLIKLTLSHIYYKIIEVISKEENPYEQKICGINAENSGYT